MFFPPHSDPDGTLSRSLGMPSRNNGPPSTWDAHGTSGNVFANPTVSSSAPYRQESNPWISDVSEHTSPHVMSESQTPAQDQRCQSGPSARNSVVPSEWGFAKNYWAEQQRLQISDPHFDKFTHHVSNVCLLEDKIQDWGVFLLTISHGSCAVDQRSGNGWISGWSKIFVFCERNSNAKFWPTRCEDCFSNWTESSIIPNSRERSVWRNQKPKRRTISFVDDRSLTWSTSTYGSLEPMILSRIMPTCLQLFFDMMIFRNSIRNGTKFYYQWRKSHLMISWKDCPN